MPFFGVDTCHLLADMLTAHHTCSSLLQMKGCQGPLGTMWPSDLPLLGPADIWLVWRTEFPEQLRWWFYSSYCYKEDVR